MKGTVECMDAVEFFVKQVAEKAGIHLKHPTVSFALRGTVAGRAWPRTNKIEFNPILLNENPERFVRETVGHEVAHLAAFVKYGNIQPHGLEWGRVMRAIGLPPVRCHNYDTNTVRGYRSVPLCREVE